MIGYGWLRSLLDERYSIAFELWLYFAFLSFLVVCHCISLQLFFQYHPSHVVTLSIRLVIEHVFCSVYEIFFDRAEKRYVCLKGVREWRNYIFSCESETKTSRHYCMFGEAYLTATQCRRTMLSLIFKRFPLHFVSFRTLAEVEKLNIFSVVC